MIPHIIEIFWIEKLRFTQYCFDQLAKVSEIEFAVTSAKRPKSIAWCLEQMCGFDRNFAFYLPVSMSLSSIFFFTAYQEFDVEQDIESIRDQFTPPAFPLHFLDIVIKSATDLKIQKTEPLKTQMMEDWRSALIKIEQRLSLLSADDAFKKRYASLSGIHTVSGAINNSTEYCHDLWNQNVAPFLK